MCFDTKEKVLAIGDNLKTDINYLNAPFLTSYEKGYNYSFSGPKINPARIIFRGPAKYKLFPAASRPAQPRLRQDRIFFAKNPASRIFRGRP